MVQAFPLDGVYARVQCEKYDECQHVWPAEVNVLFSVVSQEKKLLNFTAEDVNKQLPSATGTVNAISGQVAVASPSVQCSGILQNYGPSRAVFFCHFGPQTFDVTYQCVSEDCITGNSGLIRNEKSK